MNKFKRIFSAFIGSIVCLTFLSSQITVFAEYTENEGDVESDLALVNKYISSADEENQLYNIILEIEGKNSAEYPPTDIIVVVDQSNSMAGSRADKVKESLAILADKLLTDSSNIKLGYVGFSDDVTAATTLDLTDDKTVFTNFVNGQDSVNGGTHLQSGLKKAKELLALQPNDHQKIIIILSDGHTTYSYKPTAVDAVVGDEVRSYGPESPDYKVTAYDYGTRIGTGGTYGLQENTYKIGEDIIKNTGDATIGEILDFKQSSNHMVYAVGIELADANISDPGVYSHTNQTTSSSQGVTHTVYASWSETNPDGLYNPGEVIHLEGSYTNETSGTVVFSLVNNLVADSDTRPIPGKANDYIEDTGEVIGRVYHNGTVVEEFTLAELIVRANEPFPSTVTLNPGDTYEMIVDFTMKDFTLMGPGITALNTLHIAQFKVSTRVGSSSASFSAFAFDHNQYKGPLLGFHSAYATKQQGEYVLRNLASDGIEGNTYFDASSVNDLVTILTDDIYTIITDSIVDGKVTDPMSEYVEFVSGAFSGNNYRIWAEKDGVADSSLLAGVTVSYDTVSKTLTVNGLNLSKNERVFIEYQVKVLTTSSSFQYDTSYPTNDRTTLEPKAGEGLVDFPIPEVSVASPIRTVTLQYFANCGGDSSVQNVPIGIFTYNVGDTVNVHELTPTRNNYQFTHWLGQLANSRTVAGQQVQPGETFVIMNDMELHAQWSSVDTPTPPTTNPDSELVVEVIPPGTGVNNQNIMMYTFLLLGSLVTVLLAVKKKKEIH